MTNPEFLRSSVADDAPERLRTRPRWSSAASRASRAAIEAEIRSLEKERSQLLARQCEQYPAIVAIDRRLAILRKELESLP